MFGVIHGIAGSALCFERANANTLHEYPRKGVVDQEFSLLAFLEFIWLPASCIDCIPVDLIKIVEGVAILGSTRSLRSTE